MQHCLKDLSITISLRKSKTIYLKFLIWASVEQTQKSKISHLYLRKYGEGANDDLC